MESIVPLLGLILLIVIISTIGYLFYKKYKASPIFTIFFTIGILFAVIAGAASGVVLYVKNKLWMM